MYCSRAPNTTFSCFLQCGILHSEVEGRSFFRVCRLLCTKLYDHKCEDTVGQTGRKFLTSLTTDKLLCCWANGHRRQNCDGFLTLKTKTLRIFRNSDTTRQRDIQEDLNDQELSCEKVETRNAMALSIRFTHQLEHFAVCDASCKVQTAKCFAHIL